MHDRRLGLAGIAAAIPAGIIAGLLAAPHDHSATLLIGGLAGIAAFYLLTWCIEPHYTLTMAIMLAPFSGNWQQIGIPGALAPDRWLVVATLTSVFLRSPATRDRPRIRWGPAHWALLAAAAYAAISALAVGSLFQKTDFFKLLEAYGIFPFLVFAVAPVVFPTARERAVLLKGLVALGVYLSLTVFFEMVGPSQLVFPRYIVNAAYGGFQGRGRGPFADPVANGYALFICAIACVIAVSQWRDLRAKIFAAGVAILCAVGTLLTLERSIWISVGVGTLTAGIVIPRARRALIPIAAVGSLAVVATLVLAPGLESRVTTRANDQNPIYDRQNLANAALNMISTRPVFGFGWGQFLQDSPPYFRQSATYPLTADVATNLHSSIQTYAVELGLLGAGLYVIALFLGMGEALLSRGPPELQAWRAGLVPVVVAFFIIENFVPPTVSANLMTWLWAGVVYSARYSSARPSVTVDAAIAHA
jgi:putative inorganic carbon (hco3(-)) transporter